MTNIFVVLLSFIVFPLAVEAGGRGGLGSIVYDPSNHRENIVAAAKATLSEMHQVDSYILQAQQYLTQLRQLESLGQGEILPNIRQTQADLNTFLTYKSALENLYGSLNTAHRRFTDHALVADSRNMTWREYAAREKTLNDAAFATDAAMLQQIDANYQRMGRLQEQIVKSSGVHQSMQTMNQYMDVLAGQNAMLAQQLAAQGMIETHERDRERRYRDEVEELRERIREADRATSERERRTIEAGKTVRDSTIPGAR
jgi:P-type conjugative transfer protein TrbJ